MLFVIVINFLQQFLLLHEKWNQKDVCLAAY